MREASDRMARHCVVGEIEKPPRVLILRMRNVPAIDATGIHASSRSPASAGLRERC
jgi:hypothetical protein